MGEYATVVILLADSRGRGICKKIYDFLKKSNKENVLVREICRPGAGYTLLFDKFNILVNELQQTYPKASFLAINLGGLCSFTQKTKKNIIYKQAKQIETNICAVNEFIDYCKVSKIFLVLSTIIPVHLNRANKLKIVPKHIQTN